MNVQLQSLLKIQIFPFEVNKDTAANAPELLQKKGLWCSAKSLWWTDRLVEGVLQHY
jgi:hypothetical protein